MISIVPDPAASSGFALHVVDGAARRAHPLDIDAVFKLNRETAEAIMEYYRRGQKTETASR
jgi:hypothetical protein